jgi:uroporphyrinogen III methyltransferase/synthase
MTVYLVGAGPGDPGLLTRRAVRLLAAADVVIFDRLVHPQVLALAADRAELIDVGKQPGVGPPGVDRQDEINRLLVEHGGRSACVVRLKGGDPFVFGRGGEEVEALASAGIPFEVVPGVTSAFGAAALAGIPVTHRGLASSVTVVTGRVGDDQAPGGVDWTALAQVGGTLVVLMGMATKAEIAQALIVGGKDPETPVAVVEQGSLPGQRTVRTTLAHLAEVDLGSPAIIVIGPVAALGSAPSPTTPGPLAGRSVVVTRAGPKAKGLAEVLEHAGAHVIEMPLTTQTGPSDGGLALAAAAARVADYDWVVLTSATGAHRFMGQLRDARALGSAQVAAVGPATADALRMSGVEPDLIPAEHWAKGLIEEFPERAEGAGGRILFPCADQAPSTIPDGLAAKGWTVDRVEAYATVPLEVTDPALLAEVARADAVTFTATSSIRAYLALRGPDGAAMPVAPFVVCIGPTTAQNARALGLGPVAEAWGASSEGIVAVLADHFAGPPADGS